MRFGRTPSPKEENPKYNAEQKETFYPIKKPSYHLNPHTPIFVFLAFS
jgi:hypothetical protein